MEDTEEYYRTLCSSETLRSGKKGFFHDFSEYAMNEVGDVWTGKIFGRIEEDAERIHAIFNDPKIKDVVLTTLGRVKLLYRDKDAAISRCRRLEGFQAASAGQREKALLLLSQAVLRAPITGKCKSVDQGFALSLALLGRAEIFMALKEYERATEDLKLAKEYDLPDQTRAEFERMWSECERITKENEKALVVLECNNNGHRRIPNHREHFPPSLSGGSNLELPNASALLTIRETKSAGKEAIAVKNIYPGDNLVVEEPLAGCLLPDFYGTHCQHCFSRLRAPIGCPECSSVAFCGSKCRDIALSTYHKYECKILALLIGSGMSILSTVAFRMVTQEGLKRCLTIYKKLMNKTNTTNTDRSKEDQNIPTDDEIMESSKLSKSAKRRLRKKKLKVSMIKNEKNSVDDSTKGSNTSHENTNEEVLDVRAYDLTTHSSRRSARDFLERTLMAAFLLKCLQRVDFFDNPSPDDESPSEEEIAIGSLILRNLQLLQFNAHEFFETRYSPDHRFRGSKPIYLGVAIYPTVARFNHDCYPAVTRYFVGRNIVIQATRSLKPGDVVAENYGPIFTKRNLQERQRTLSGRYWFRCTCKACQEDWPRFENLTNDSVRLKCISEGCTTLHLRPKDPSKTIKCCGCQRRINLEERIISLQDCEALYAQALNEMEGEQQCEATVRLMIQATTKFHEIAVPPHRDTHLTELALAACLADSGNTWKPPS